MGAADVEREAGDTHVEGFDGHLAVFDDEEGHDVAQGSAAFEFVDVQLVADGFQGFEADDLRFGGFEESLNVQAAQLREKVLPEFAFDHQVADEFAVEELADRRQGGEGVELTEGLAELHRVQVIMEAETRIARLGGVVGALKVDAAAEEPGPAVLHYRRAVLQNQVADDVAQVNVVVAQLVGPHIDGQGNVVGDGDGRGGLGLGYRVVSHCGGGLLGHKVG